MLGCMLLLLIVAMMSDPPHHGIGVDLYKSQNAERMPAALRDDAMKLFLMRDGVIYFGNHRFAAEDLPKEIHERVQTGAQRKVFLVVDERARFRDVSIVLDDVREAGIWDIAFLAELEATRK